MWKIKSNQNLRCRFFTNKYIGLKHLALTLQGNDFVTTEQFIVKIPRTC